MTLTELHQARHHFLHEASDELMADYFAQHPHAKPSTTTVAQLMIWSYRQTLTPTTPQSEHFVCAHCRRTIDGAHVCLCREVAAAQTVREAMNQMKEHRA